MMHPSTAFPAMEAIRKRISVRSYSDRPVEEGLLERLRSSLGQNSSGPFGIPVRFRLLDLERLDQKELRGLGTYGVIRGARLFILGAVKDRKGGLEDLGYCLEKVILEAAALGLGTCWLAGTFRRAAFARQMDLASGELLPAITPLGYPAEIPAVRDRVMRLGARARRRKPWAELFFTADCATPLPEEKAGKYRDALEAVRLGPSATNRQPWRVVQDRDGLYHLYLHEAPLYNRALGKIRIQNIDMGIAMCHFELAARERGLAGRWNPYAAAAPAPARAGWQPIASWVPSPR